MASRRLVGESTRVLRLQLHRITTGRTSPERD